MNPITNPLSTRICGCDLIRVVAIFFVIAGHFFELHTPFKRLPFNGASMFIQCMLLYIFYVGVPLFMMLTGYLNANKTPTKQYYRGMVRVLVAYLVFSVITILFRKYYLGEEYTWLHWGMKILNYTGIPYAWYIEMWIGLALLTPFLNYMYKAIPSKKQKILLLVTLFVMTSLPKFLNRSGLDVIPAYYEQALYPLMYYFLGNFIREYKPQVKFWQGCVIVLSIALVTPIVSLLHLAGPNILWLGGGQMAYFVS